MEIQFEQNRDFNQRHRDDQEPVSDTQEGQKGEPQGEEGNPNQRFANRESYQKDHPELDRRPADVANGNAADTGSEDSSAVAGVMDDTPLSVSKQATEKGEDPNHNADLENKEDTNSDEDNEQ
ncbi:hypothetical protein [Nubsella zeaxanthinifaciens]|uniref:hypothetical protein n=1 Tax=Nubsella zeaxanthinifaciens TaxID=392412 RepID=UPI000DE42A2D|nr:hypothetical protein [Nubsella zeaxanthinifaciens]